jgi:hypothetical protein
MTQMNCFLLSGGLFQIYSNPVDYFLSYEDISNKAIRLYSPIYPNFTSTFNKYYNIMSLQKNEQTNIEKINLDFMQELNLDSPMPISILFEDIKNHFETIVLNYLDLFLEKFKNVYFYYENLLYLLIDYNIFKLLGIDMSLINFTLNIDIIIREKQISPKKCLICDYDLNNLYYYHSLGCFTIYLSHLAKMSLPTQKDKDYINSINDNNIRTLEEKGIFFDFSLTFMIQSMNYINYMDNYDVELKDIKGKTLSEKILNKTGAYNVLLIYRFFFIEKEVQRAQFFLCTDKIMYTTYIGDHFKNCYYFLQKYYVSGNYSKIDCVLCKLCTSCCLTTYPQLISDLSAIRKENPEIFFNTNPDNVEICLTRGLLVNLMKNFINKISSNKLILPTTYEVPYTSIDTYNKFNQYLSRNGLKYPLMLKFDGPVTKYDHLQINLICDKGLKNFISYFKEFSANDDKTKIKIIVQEFIQHGGYLIKLYRIKKTNYIYYRPSLPDIQEDMMTKCPEYQKGYFKFETKDMGTQAFKDFWKRINGENNNFKDFVNERFLGNVAAQYEDDSGDSLVGLDFIMDVKKGIYYLIDINPFPAYSELYNEMNQVFSDHFNIEINDSRKKIVNL